MIIEINIFEIVFYLSMASIWLSVGWVTNIFMYECNFNVSNRIKGLTFLCFLFGVLYSMLRTLDDIVQAIGKKMP